MTFTFNGTPTTADLDGVSTSSSVVTMPTGIVAGELLLVAINSGTGATAWNNTVGWTKVFGQTDVKNAYALWWRVATGSEAASYTFTSTVATSYHMVTCWRLGGAATSNPIRAFSIPATTAGADATASTPPTAMSGVLAADLEIYIGFGGTTGGTVAGTITMPGAPWVTRASRNGPGSMQKTQNWSSTVGNIGSGSAPVFTSSNTAMAWSECAIAVIPLVTAVTFQAAATAVGSGSVAANARTTQVVSAPTTGGGSVTANDQSTQSAAALCTSGGSITSAATRTEFLLGVNTGVGSVVAGGVLALPGVALTVGTGSVLASAGALAVATLTGTAVVLAVTQQDNKAVAWSLGSGKVFAAVQVTQLANSAVTGIGTVTTLLTVTRYLQGTAFAVATVTFADILTRVRQISGRAQTASTIFPLNQLVIITFHTARAAARTAAGEKPTRNVTTTGLALGSARVRINIMVRSVQAYAQADAIAVGDLTNADRYALALAKTTATGHLLPVKHLDQIIVARATAVTAELIAARKMTDVLSVVSEGSLFPEELPTPPPGAMMVEQSSFASSEPLPQDSPPLVFMAMR